MSSEAGRQSCRPAARAGGRAAGSALLACRFGRLAEGRVASGPWPRGQGQYPTNPPRSWREGPAPEVGLPPSHPARAENTTSKCQISPPYEPALHEVGSGKIRRLQRRRRFKVRALAPRVHQRGPGASFSWVSLPGPQGHPRSDNRSRPPHDLTVERRTGLPTPLEPQRGS